MKSFLSSYLRLACAICCVCAVPASALSDSTVADSPDWPAKSWSNFERPEEAGWSSQKLGEARARGDSIGSAAVMIVSHGRIVGSWGDLARKYQAHSMRKSLLCGLVGIYVAAGKIDPLKTLDELNIDDEPTHLTDIEKSARLIDLLGSRSGIYIAAAMETPDRMLLRPKRGSHAPGTHWWYNNWDFNAVGTIFERQTGEKIFPAFEAKIARPIEMEDFTASDGDYAVGRQSMHAGYPVRISTRDLARFGLLCLRSGKWRDQQIIPEPWIDTMTRTHSDTGTCGYGLMWWTVEAGKSLPGASLPNGSFWAWGTGGHYLIVVPSLDLVIVHRVNTDVRGPVVDHAQFGPLLQMLLTCRATE